MDFNQIIRQDILAVKEYIPGKPIEEVKRELGIDDVIKMASNENPLGPGKKAVAAISEAALSSHLYPDGAVFQLRKKLAAKLGVKEEQLIVGNGSDEILKMLGETFFCPGDELITADPTFAEYSFVAALMGAKTTAVPVKPDFSYDLDGMLKAITPKTKMIVLCNPNNPVGNIIRKPELDGFLKQLPENIIVVLDEAYAEYVTDAAYPESLAYLKDYPNVIILRTFSKIYGLGGLRVGYGIAGKEMIALLNRVREPFNVNKLAQAAAEAALDDTEHFQASLAVNNQGKKYLSVEFERMGLYYVPSETNFIFVRIETKAEEFFRQMLKRGVIIRSGHVFGYPDFIRVTIGTEEQNKRFIREMKAILQR